MQSNLCIYLAFHTVSIINEYDYSIKGMQCQGTTFLEMNKDIWPNKKKTKKKQIQLSGF